MRKVRDHGVVEREQSLRDNALTTLPFGSGMDQRHFDFACAANNFQFCGKVA